MRISMLWGLIRWLWFTRKSEPVFDHERRELRCGKTTIPFQDIEVRVFRYHGREPRSASFPFHISVFNDAADLTRGTEWKYRVYARAGKQRVDLEEFRSQTDADEYADEIRTTIAEVGD